MFTTKEELIVYLHIVLASEDGRGYGGHLMQAKVWTTLELVVAEIKHMRSYREKSTTTGLNEILVD